MMKRQEEKAAVAIRGNSGNGLAAAKPLQEQSAKVAISGGSREILNEATEALGNGALAIQANGTKLPDLDRSYAEVRRNWAELMCCL